MTTRQLFACEPTRLSGFLAAHRAVARLHCAGMAPYDKAAAAMFGDNNGRTVVADIVNDTATVDIVGVLLESVQFWEHLECGPITDTGHLTDCLHGLASDPGIRNVVLRMDSPGGSSSGIDAAAAAVRRLVAAGKTVSVQAQGCLASAAYWIASQATSISASPTCLVGSIGCYMVLADSSLAQEQEGIVLHLISSGPEKGLGADGKVTDAVKAEAQRTVSDIAAAFRADIAAGRRFDAARVDSVATGRIWLGSEALAMGLIDHVSTIAALTDGSPSDRTANTPAAAAVKTKESAMDVKQVAALAAKHKDHAVAILAAAAEGKDEAQIESLITEQIRSTELAALKTDNERLTAALAEANAKAEKLGAELVEAKATAGIAKGAAQDPGAGTHDASVKRSSMSRDQKASFIKEHGKAAYQALPL